MGFHERSGAQLLIMFQGNYTDFKNTSYTDDSHSNIVCKLSNLKVSFSLQDMCSYIKQACF